MNENDQPNSSEASTMAAAGALGSEGSRSIGIGESSRRRREEPRRARLDGPTRGFVDRGLDGIEHAAHEKAAGDGDEPNSPSVVAAERAGKEEEEEDGFSLPSQQILSTWDSIVMKRLG
uniref:DUF834 domain-containing protein n=1 Tax=Oryza punctata TaxID=4537 RepID=A0A0E0MAY2_ORYPU